MLTYIIAVTRWIKKMTGCKTWQIESAFVFIVLASVASVSRRGWVEWLGVFAVWFSFMHAQVAERLAEAEALREQKQGTTEVACHRWSKRYFYCKEIFWFAYFILIGAWSALVGVIVFLAYPWWRRAWKNSRVYQ